jgi:hypothetical protein
VNDAGMDDDDISYKETKADPGLSHSRYICLESHLPFWLEQFLMGSPFPIEKKEFDASG